MEIVAGAAGNVIASLFLQTTAKINSLIHLAKDVDEMKNELERVKNLLSEIEHRMGDDPQTPVPPTMKIWLSHVRQLPLRGDEILDAYRQHKQRLLCGWLNCFERRCLYKRIREWKIHVKQDLKNGYLDFSLINNVDAILASAPRCLVHPGTGSFAGEQIKYLESRLEYFLICTYESRLIVVYGMAGVGKTSLLKSLNNNKNVQRAFEVVIWVTVSHNRSTKDIQYSIAQCIGLNLDERLSDDERALRLNTFLMTRRFLLILDDVWTAIRLDRLGVSLSDGRSKIVLSTRNKDLARTMNSDQSLQMEPLSEEEAWELFSKRAFGGEAVLPEIEQVARKVAARCGGLPLALNAIAASLSKQMDVRQWIDTCQRLCAVDETFLTIHGDFEPEVLHRMKLSYDDLHDSLKLCFLSCAMFPEDANIDVEYLVRLWAVEPGSIGLGRDQDRFGTARSFLNILINRCLVEGTNNSWSEEVDFCRLHDVFRYFATHIAEKEEKYLFRAGQNLENFPPLEETQDCTKISLMSNKICSLPEGFKCPTLVTLLLRGNTSLQKIPHDFFESLTALKVLDLSDTDIESLPASIGDLKSLMFLRLSETRIRSLPRTICQLKCLKYLNLHNCRQLKFVPPAISELSSLESLDILGCERLVVQINGGGTASLNDLTKVTTLVEVQLAVRPGIGLIKLMRRWTFLRSLTLDFKMQDANAHVKFPAFPHLKSVRLQNSKMVTLTFQPFPGCGYYEFPYVRQVTLYKCPKLKLFSNPAKIGIRELQIKECESLKTLTMNAWAWFTSLEILCLERLHNLESMLGTGSEAMAEVVFRSLRKLKVWRCEKFKKLPLGFHKGLEVLVGDENWWNGLVWEEGDDWNSMRRHLQSIYTNSSTFTLQDFSIE